MKYKKNLIIIVIASCLIGLASCASVPDETVQLSDAVGEDIQQLYPGYRATVRWSFDQMRQNGLAIIDERWTPVYIKSYVTKGRLVQFAKEGKTEAVEYWARKAINRIDQKRKDFLQPLQEKESALLAEIDEAFGRTIRANATVTAHLKSIRKVKEAQNEVLQAAGLEDVPAKINKVIASASDFTANLTEKVKAAAKQVEAEAN